MANLVEILAHVSSYRAACLFHEDSFIFECENKNNKYSFGLVLLEKQKLKVQSKSKEPVM